MQGDLLIRRDPATRKILDRFLVITADCDISQRKFGGELACLSIIPIQDYIRTIWAARKLKRELDRETERICALLNKWNSKRIADAGVLSPSAVLDWVKNSEPSQICADLEIPSPDSAGPKNTIRLFRSAFAAVDENCGSDKLAQLVAFRSALKSESLAKCQSEALKQAQGEPLPEDVFLVPALPQVDAGAALILLRELKAVKPELVCFRAIDANLACSYLRIGRLEPTFKYAVSRAFGSLYSRIGLPVAFESRCKAALEGIIDLDWEQK